MIYLVSFLLVVSLVANGILVWYTRKLIARLWDSTNGIDDIQRLLNQYTTFLSAVYQMEEFYGDEVINRLIKDTKSLEKFLKDYKARVVADVNNPNDTEDEAEEELQEK
jgi:hypothetical protein